MTGRVSFTDKMRKIRDILAENFEEIVAEMKYITLDIKKSLHGVGCGDTHRKTRYTIKPENGKTTRNCVCRG